MLAQSATSAIISLVLVKYYSSEMTPGHMLAGVWLSYFLVTLSLALLTTDVYQIGASEAKDLTTWWRFVYWA